MKFSKKLLTALLPIAATTVVVPVIASCSKKTSWSFSYGNSINCLNRKPSKEGEGSYHSLSDVKNAVKSHIDIDATKSVSDVSKLPSWELTGNKQLMYFDLIASCCLLTQSALKPSSGFSLIWDLTSQISLDYVDATTQEITSGTTTTLSYVAGGTEGKEVYLKFNNDLSVKSYAFQNTKIGA